MTQPALLDRAEHPESGVFKLAPTQAPSRLSLPHLRGWLAELVAGAAKDADDEPCLFCEGAGVLVCDACECTGRVGGETCEACEGQPLEACGDCDGARVAIAVVMGVRARADELLRRLARCRGLSATAQILPGGALQIGSSRPIREHRAAERQRETEVVVATYAHEQLPLRIV